MKTPSKPIPPAGKPNVRQPLYRPRVVELARHRGEKHRPGQAQLQTMAKE